MGTVTGLWQTKLPDEVRKAVAGMSLKPETLEATLKLADAVYKTLTPAKPLAGIAGTAELAAFKAKPNKGQGKKTGSGKGAGQSNNTPKPRANRHPDNPPEDACREHWKFGKEAWFCRKPDECPWKQYKGKPPTKK